MGAREATVYLVGGCVRDYLLGRPSHDLDVAVGGDALSLGRRLADQFNGAFYILDAERGTARVLFREWGDTSTIVDLARLLHGDIYADLQARDFTINAMALSLGPQGIGDLIDPFDGRRDLLENRLRVVSPFSFRDDPVRVLRAVRISREFDLRIEPETNALALDAVSLLDRVSPERIRDEFCRILLLPSTVSAVSYLKELGVLHFLFRRFGGDVVPESGERADFNDKLKKATGVLDAWEELFANQKLTLTGEAEQTAHVFRRVIERYYLQLSDRLATDIAGQRTRELLLKWVILLLYTGGSDNVEDILAALHFSRDELRQGKTLSTMFLVPGEWARQKTVSRGQLHRFYRQTQDCGPEVIALYLADCLVAAKNGELNDPPELIADLADIAWNAYFEHYDEIVAPPQLIDGWLLMAHFNRAQGPWLRDALEAVQEAQAEGKIQNREEALEWLQRYHLPDEM